MPKYCYRCEECEHQFEIRHSIQDKMHNCSECEEINSLVRIPQLIVKPVEHVHSKVGDKVKEFIELNKEALREQIRNSTESYEP